MASPWMDPSFGATPLVPVDPDRIDRKKAISDEKQSPNNGKVLTRPSLAPIRYASSIA